MNKYAVRAANLRAKYIVDKYQYGITCNKCSYDYKEHLIKDFRSLCYTDVCEDLDLSDIIKNKTLTCTLSATNVPYTVCGGAPYFVDCDIVYNGCRTNNFEDNDDIITRVVTGGETLYFTLSSIIIDGVSYHSIDTPIEISPSNIDIQKVNNQDFVMNVLNYINALEIPNFNIDPLYVEREYINIERDGSLPFSITTKANEDGSSLVRGVIITEEGLQSVQLTVAAAYTDVGVLTPPESDVFQAGVICSNYSKC